MQCDVIVVLGSGYGQDPRDYTGTPEGCGDEMVMLLVLARRWLHKERDEKREREIHERQLR